MAITKEQKQELIKKYGKNPNDAGNPEVQIVSLGKERMFGMNMIQVKKR